MVCFQDITQNMIAIWQKSHIQLTSKITISTWSLLLGYIDDTLRVSIAQYVTKNSIIRHLPHHHGISQDFQCQPKVDLGLSVIIETAGCVVFKLDVPIYYY